jgi:cyclic beta-1,2-glucan synthetase
MANNNHRGVTAEIPEPENSTVVEAPPRAADWAQHAQQWARELVWLPGVSESPYFEERLKTLNRKLNAVLVAVDARIDSAASVSNDLQWLGDNSRLAVSAQIQLQEAINSLRRVPHVRTSDKTIMPRAIAVARGLLSSVEYRYSDHAFANYMDAFQTVTPLDMRELALVVPALKLTLLEELAGRAEKALADPGSRQAISELIISLRDVTEAPWNELLERAVAFERILAADPVGAYSRMDFQSRELYRQTVAHLAEHSDCSELEIAQFAVDLAVHSKKRLTQNSRLALREAHVGYYLIGEGAEELRRRAGVRLPFAERLQAFLRRHPEEFYLGGIEVLTLLIVIAIMTPVYNAFNTFYGRIFAIILLLLPCSQSAIEVMNHLTTALLHPRILPKLDFSENIPDDCVTMVVIPTLLLDERQVRRLVDDLEVRYLGNTSANLHFALLTDLPDSAETPNHDDPLVALCEELIRGLNEKYSTSVSTFAMFHRHRVYNPREGVWMGWERKRGKLLDFNRLIKGEYDSFPVKVGDLTLLRRVRFVLTLDTDTELPRGTAYRLIGALAHPLNQAIVDPRANIVTAGYGILQPRVGISVTSAARSRLASIYSGQTGFDIYSRAVSDVYQDLNGEGIFTGKGIYEVQILSQVLEHRFPRNALLSHDLIEGAYARAGLVSDVEVIDEYPSHYSAHNRRKHRWLRGDWQIVSWLFGRVPDEKGHRVPNPISFLSRWKIFDNLRRSLVEAGMFVLFVLGWTVLPGRPVYWTLITIAILFVPPWFEFLFSVSRALMSRRLDAIRDAFIALGTATLNEFLTLTFLAHQTLLSADAVLRTFYRRIVSRQRLLQWETAAEAEMGTGKLTFVDALLNWTPVVALIVGIIVYFSHRHSFTVALPVLILWACSKPVSLWLNRPPRPLQKAATLQDKRFLRHAALYTWRYFASHSNQEHNWLIPDNVQEEPAKIAARLSPTNLGLLLNARQVACEFGYLTVPKFVTQTTLTMDTVMRLPKERGHLLNWYDTRTLQPLKPRFISTVDNGNLAASLITLKNGCLEFLQGPLLSSDLLEGYADHLCVLAELKAIPRRVAHAFEKDSRTPWLDRLLVSSELPPTGESAANAEDVRWFTRQTSDLIEQVKQAVTDYTPWLLAEYEPLFSDPVIQLTGRDEQIPLARLPDFIDRLRAKLEAAVRDTQSQALMENLWAQLPDARRRCLHLIAGLEHIASLCEELIRAMDFNFLLDRRRKLLSIGYDVESGKVQSACYDLLASEARLATFVAVAKGDISQESWFQMSRSHVVAQGRPVLLSWTGTMFEYLMPGLWLRAYPDTLLAGSKEAAVSVQQAYASDKRIPWGISESAFAENDEEGNYSYRAFGVPQLAIQQDEDRLVVAPYATLLALGIDPSAAIKNLRWMIKRGWFGAYGFYESADFTPHQKRHQRYVLVRSWMSHHHGMSLLSIANFLKGGIVQNWFHRDARVQATDLLLQERPVRHVAHSAKDGRRAKKSRQSKAKGRRGGKTVPPVAA